MTGLAGLAAAFKTTRSRAGFDVGKEGNSSNEVLRMGACVGRTAAGLDIDEPGVGLATQVGAERFELFKLKTLMRFAMEDDDEVEADGTGREAATASIRFHTLCVPVLGRPFADDLRAKILDL